MAKYNRTLSFLTDCGISFRKLLQKREDRLVPLHSSAAWSQAGFYPAQHWFHKPLTGSGPSSSAHALHGRTQRTIGKFVRLWLFNCGPVHASQEPEKLAGFPMKCIYWKNCYAWKPQEPAPGKTPAGPEQCRQLLIRQTSRSITPPSKFDTRSGQGTSVCSWRTCTTCWNEMPPDGLLDKNACSNGLP